MNTNQQRAEFLLVGKSLQITSAWRQWSSHGWGERLTEEHMRWNITTWPVTTTQLTCAKNNSSASRNKDCIVLCTAERSCCSSEELQDWSSLKEAGKSRTKAAQCCQLCLYCSTLIKTISEEPSLRRSVAAVWRMARFRIDVNTCVWNGMTPKRRRKQTWHK